MYAVIETGSKQYRVTEGDTLTIEKLEIEAGQTATFDKVLLVGKDGGEISVGQPLLEGATVTADVVDHQKGPKLVAFKMRRRKGYHRKVGHRQPQTIVKISKINA